jgi:hypothetical protein
MYKKVNPIVFTKYEKPGSKNGVHTNPNNAKNNKEYLFFKKRLLIKLK